MRELSRREFLGAGLVLTTGTTLAQVPTPVSERNAQPMEPFRFSRVLDLTHTLTPDFPTWSGQEQLTMERVMARPKDPWNIFRWHLHEHTGTHLDAPLHKSDRTSADQIPAADLIGSLAVVDIRQKVATDADSELTVTDLKNWEAKHGHLPAGGIVAMCSGWDSHVRTPKFRNPAADGALHTPGFHIEAVEFLLAERNIKGIVVDTLSLDRGLSKDYAVHVRWLGSNRWGLECAANLGQLPPQGATLVVGGPKIAGASGGPSRVFALL